MIVGITTLERRRCISDQLDIAYTRLKAAEKVTSDIENVIADLRESFKELLPYADNSTITIREATR